MALKKLYFKNLKTEKTRIMWDLFNKIYLEIKQFRKYKMVFIF